MPALKGDASIATGTILGRYRIERLLGAGGMAEVYAARDTKLGRAVALKVLPDGDPARVERFIREAQLASSLSHPAVVTVHDSGDALVDDHVVHFLAMELVEGDDLARWGRGRDLRKVIAVAADVADGLSRAHATGIIHRDLKPRNIMVAKGGHAKVLDFGVAKLTEPAEGLSQSDTAPTAAVGTAAYMSPEQIEGKDLDPRTDIFSFGCVLFEIVTGQAPFQRATPVETMHAIVHDPTPSIRGTRSDVVPGLERIVRKCLVKDRDERYQSMKDVALDLREIARDETAETPPPRRHTSRTLAIGFALAAVVAVLAIWSIRVRRGPLALAVDRPPTMIRLTNTGNVMGGTISPDGRYVVYVTEDGDAQTLWVKQIATATAVRVVPPQQVKYSDVRISPDGNYIYYGVAEQSEPNVNILMQVPLLGGTARRIASDFDGWMALAPDGKRVAFRRFSALDRVFRLFIEDIDTGVETEVLTKRFPEYIGQLAWSPDGTRITFAGRAISSGPVMFNFDIARKTVSPLPSPTWRSFGGMAWLPDGSGLVVTAGDQLQPAQLWIVPADGSSPRKITTDISQYDYASVTADSRAIAASRMEITANIWVVSTDDPKDARALTTGVGNRNGMGGVRFLPNGDVLFVAPKNGAPHLQVVSRAGGEARDLGNNLIGWDPAVSPDGKHIAFASPRGGSIELWTSDINGGDLQQITSDAKTGIGPNTSPSWFPDSRSIVYVSSGSVQAAWKATLGSPAIERITDPPVNLPQISPDGQWLLCRLRSRTPGVPLWRTALMRIGAKEEPRYFDIPRFGTPPDAKWFPDGSRFAFLDYAGGVANIWSQDIGGGAPKQLTHFDAGQICGYDISRDARSIAVSRCDRVNDLVLISDFR